MTGHDLARACRAKVCLVALDHRRAPRCPPTFLTWWRCPRSVLMPMVAALFRRSGPRRRPPGLFCCCRTSSRSRLTSSHGADPDVSARDRVASFAGSASPSPAPTSCYVAVIYSTVSNLPAICWRAALFLLTPVFSSPRSGPRRATGQAHRMISRPGATPCSTRSPPKSTFSMAASPAERWRSSPDRLWKARRRDMIGMPQSMPGGGPMSSSPLPDGFAQYSGVGSGCWSGNRA